MLRSITSKYKKEQVESFCERLFSLDINQSHVDEILKNLKKDLEDLKTQGKSFFAEFEQNRRIAIQCLEDFSQSDSYAFKTFLDGCYQNQIFINKVHSFFENKYHGHAPHSELKLDKLNKLNKLKSDMIEKSKIELIEALRKSR